MDRLVCGDVGFGKTEVAIRAAFKAVQDGKQVAVLVPTTLLAQQHFQTFSDRFAGYPVRVEVLSRVPHHRPGPKVVVEGVGRGEVDVVIGTHRLLSERRRVQGPRPARRRRGAALRRAATRRQIKQLADRRRRAHAHAPRPIPRTLEMSLTGIRDLTLLNTPPAERQPILTYVGEYDERAVGEAIRRELLREGQVFFVHNRVQDIEHVAAELRELVPEARIAVAHGQMDEGTLEQVVLDFWEGEYDVLVCTTIIESGIDMPTVNTLVVDRADLLGLGPAPPAAGPGRPGRPAGLRLPLLPARPVAHRGGLRAAARPSARPPSWARASRSPCATSRSAAPATCSAPASRGHIAAVGYDLYCQMVTEAVAELKGEAVREPAEIKLDLPLDANLPPDYVRQGGAAARGLPAAGRGHRPTAEVDDIRAEWEDRYGPVPAGGRGAARRSPACGPSACAPGSATSSSPGTRPSPGPSHVARIGPLDLAESKQIRLQRLVPKAVYKEDTGELQVPVSKPDEVAPALVALLDELVPAAPLVTAGA